MRPSVLGAYVLASRGGDRLMLLVGLPPIVFRGGIMKGAFSWFVGFALPGVGVLVGLWNLGGAPRSICFNDKLRATAC